jgi:hypothetical protein
VGDIRYMKNLKGKRLLVRPGSRWEGNIEMDITETGCEDLNLTQVAQDRIR